MGHDGVMSRWSRPPGLRTDLISHRGGAAWAPENSWLAFTKSYELGCRVFESDARTTSDGVCVAFHDSTLDRVGLGRGPVSAIPWSELSMREFPAGSSVPRMDDLIAAFPDVSFSLDAKDGASVGSLVAAIRRTNSASRVCVTSFSHRRLQAVRRQMPMCYTAFSPREVMSFAASHRLPLLPRGLRRLGSGRVLSVPEFSQRIRLVTTEFVERAHALDLLVDVWTVNDAASMERLIAYGVDGIMTDHPEMLNGLLA